MRFVHSRMMTEADHELARYNDEVAHGLVHTEEWRQRMRAAQESWDARVRMDMEATGATPMSGGGWMLMPAPKRRGWWRRMFGRRRG